MKEKDMKYLKMQSNRRKILRTEILFTPLLLFLPLFVSVFMIYDWFTRGFSMGVSVFNAELIFGIIILVGNIVFDIPFIISLKRSFKERMS